MLIISSLNLLSQVPFYVPTNGLIGWWPFNGNANDESGNGNNGTVNGAVLTTDRFNNTDAAYTFDGINSVINISASNTLNITDSISISAWVVRNNSSNNLPQGIVGPPNALTVNGGYYLRVINQNADLAVSQPYTETLSNQTIPGSVWVHLVATYDNSISKIYINGVLDTQVTIGSGLLDSWSGSNPITFGQEINYNLPTDLHAWDGKLDDIGIWNRALDSAEVKQLFVNTTGVKELFNKNNFIVYLNPTSNFITIKSNKIIPILPYQIYDEIGRNVLTGKLHGQINNVNFNDLPAGLYILQIGIQNPCSFKLIKQ